MIGNITRGNNFKGLLKYLLNKEKAEFLDSNISLDRDRSLIVPMEQYLTHQYAYQFDLLAARRPDAKKPVYHVSLSLHPGEQISDDRWKEIAKRYLFERGFKNCQKNNSNPRLIWS